MVATDGGTKHNTAARTELWEMYRIHDGSEERVGEEGRKNYGCDRWGEQTNRRANEAQYGYMDRAAGDVQHP
jgi:hypothetical protein